MIIIRIKLLLRSPCTSVRLNYIQTKLALNTNLYRGLVGRILLPPPAHARAFSIVYMRNVESEKASFKFNEI